ncbi:NUDIX domain-containing protein [Patescibacteria group bacterium]|nr:NUDIX domain-containing protein [Patescibacteria group bacterium]MBU3999900.1 NUDIX domain-containing protein [Patescibacteria group bacterium]MBU4057059.1 NUDIX domain-containing protein [Patescibacteria group bacterium]MBU4368690.1 NUDIX domain-containing protein [Patescibacteria group bacterium]
MNERPKVGVGVIVIRNGKILLGKRKNAHGEGAWCYPGGHLEYGESWEECSRREVMEEAGIEIGNIRFGIATNDIFEDEQKHYITICMIVDFTSGVIKVMEPDKCEKWGWFEWDKLPQPLFLTIINQIKVGFNPLNPS